MNNKAIISQKSKNSGIVSKASQYNKSGAGEGIKQSVVSQYKAGGAN